VILRVGLLAPPVEDVVGREMDQRDTLGGEVAHRLDVDPPGGLGLVLAFVDVVEAAQLKTTSGPTSAKARSTEAGSPMSSSAWVKGKAESGPRSSVRSWPSWPAPPVINAFTGRGEGVQGRPDLAEEFEPADV